MDMSHGVLPPREHLEAHIVYLEKQNADLVAALEGIEGFAKEFIDDAVGGIPMSGFYTSEVMVAECQAVLKALAQVGGK